MNQQDQHTDVSGAVAGTDDLVWGFQRPHKPGTTCLQPCKQCGAIGDRYVVANGAHGERVEPIPMFIVTEATVEDWQRSNRARGGTGEPIPLISYFYFVRTD